MGEVVIQHDTLMAGRSRSFLVPGNGSLEFLLNVYRTYNPGLMFRFGGIIQREAVMAGADWFVYSFDEMTAALKRYKVTFNCLSNPS